MYSLYCLRSPFHSQQATTEYNSGKLDLGQFTIAESIFFLLHYVFSSYSRLRFVLFQLDFCILQVTIYFKFANLDLVHLYEKCEI